MGRPLTHQLSSIDVEKKIAVCSKCGPVRIYADRLGQPWACGRKPPERQKGGPQLEHALTDVDGQQHTAVCAVCGPVKIYWKVDKWICIQRSLVVDAPKKHRISDVDEVSLTGTCAVCGRVPVRFSTRNLNIGYWYCVRKSNEMVTAWRKKNGAATYATGRRERSEHRARLHQEQGGICAICKQSIQITMMCVDHDHETNRIRGGLCSRCNSMIGFAASDPVRLMNAIEYLDNHEKNEQQKPLIPVAPTRRRKYHYFDSVVPKTAIVDAAVVSSENEPDPPV